MCQESGIKRTVEGVMRLVEDDSVIDANPGVFTLRPAFLLPPPIPKPPTTSTSLGRSDSSRAVTSTESCGTKGRGERNQMNRECA